MSIFIKINAKERNLFFEKTKKVLSCNYENFAKKIGVSRAMIFKYKRGDYLLPEKIFDYLVKTSDFLPGGIERIEKEYCMKKTIKRPELNHDFAEILGVLNGDGHLSKINYEVSITGNLKEMDYFEYLKKKFEGLFGITFKIETFPYCLKLRAYSVELINFLNKEYGLPKGEKKGNLFVPKRILSEKKLITSYLRGLFDTDGTFYIRRKKDPVVEISSADKRYLKQIKDNLGLLGFKCSLGKFHLSIYKREDIKRFFELIKPANPKHLNKYEKYLELCAGGPENPQ